WQSAASGCYEKIKLAQSTSPAPAPQFTVGGGQSRNESATGAVQVRTDACEDRFHRASSLSAWSTTFSTVKPKCLSTFWDGPEAPKVVIPTIYSDCCQGGRQGFYLSRFLSCVFTQGARETPPRADSPLGAVFVLGVAGL